MVSDGKPLSIEGYYVDDRGKKTDLKTNTPSNDEALFASFSVLDNFELNFRLPFHYDGDVNETNLKGLGLGDVQLGAKGSFPFNEWFVAGLSGEIIAPSGSTSKGFRPRHRWFIYPNRESYAYTANNWTFAGFTHLTFEQENLLDINAYAGLLKEAGESQLYTLWGLGFNLFPEKILSIIFEVSGETPIRTTNSSHHFVTSPIRFTPALRLRLPKETFITISGDVGLNYFRDNDKDNGIPVNLKSGNKSLHYTSQGVPNVGMAVTISKQFDFSWIDTDGDGIKDREDLCPNTNRNMIVNSRGCPVDEDQDGVFNIVDLCPGTPIGLEVDFNGCPVDRDKDGIFDYLDKCLGTPLGMAVDSSGCKLDSDRDGIDDNNDKCPDTRPEDVVDDFGCPLDEDHDGITNMYDKCPNTPEGVSIDKFGCPLDFDKDGVPDDLDQCPNSAEGEPVNEQGCPADTDRDGVPDSKDNCPDTPENVSVDAKGCRLDQDEDGIFDEEDKCPNTPWGAPIDSLGCPIDSDGDGIADWFDQCPGTFSNVVVDNNGCPENERINFNSIARRIRFKQNDTTLYNSSYTALNDIIATMRQNQMSLEIQCAAPQKKLAENRARIIYEYLEYKGIKADRLQYHSYEGRLPKRLSTNNNEGNGIRLTPYTRAP